MRVFDTLKGIQSPKNHFYESGFLLMAGPCSVESEAQLFEVSEKVSKSGAHLIRGGLHKMRTDPNSFQGHGEKAYGYVEAMKEKLGLPFITEVTDPRQIEKLEGFVDAFQVGSRNMYNYALLKELGNTQKPILLKRGFSGMVKEWLLAAEYVRKYGNPNVLLCERGIRTFEGSTRNTLDLNSVAYVKKNSDLPVIVDPSHGTGASELVEPLALAGAAAGADGLIIEVHPNPKEALSDGYQALTPKQFDSLAQKLKKLLPALA
jgi:3-deoxy-7-phosphoheptulonate synthase